MKLQNPELLRTRNLIAGQWVDADAGGKLAVLNPANGDKLADVPLCGADETRRQIWVYSLILVPVTLTPTLAGFMGKAYLLAAIMLGAAFLQRAWHVYRIREGEAAVRCAKKLFGFSILYLFALFGMILAEHAVGRLLGIFG